MIVKNEERNMVRCLESLKALIENPKVELIIVDTGSTDKTVEICNRYTDKVYFHEWNNNFSDMRNKSISYAKGEWIFIFDADEELLDPEMVIEVLEEESTKRMNTINVHVFNMLYSYREDSSTEFESWRFFRNDGEFAYDGVVHNQPRAKEPSSSCKVRIKHYGYVSDDTELMSKKYDRTVTLLKEELEKNPDNYYYRMKLAESYGMNGFVELALEQIRMAYELDTKRQNMYIFGNYLRISMALNLFDESIRVGLEGISYKDDYIDLYFQVANAYYFTRQADEAIDYYKYYFALYDNLSDLQISWDISVDLYSIDTVSHEIARKRLTEMYFVKEKYEEGFDYLDTFPDDIWKVEHILKVGLLLARYEAIKAYYMTIKDNRDLKEYFIATIDKIKAEFGPGAVSEIDEMLLNQDDAVNIKEEIGRLIDCKDVTGARAMISHYEETFGNDMELLLFKSKIALLKE